MSKRTVVDILASRLTGIKVAKTHSIGAIEEALARHPDCEPLKEAWLCRMVNDIYFGKYKPKIN